MPGVLFWTPWIPLAPETVADLSDVMGVYEVKVEKRLVDYPSGRSAMIYYGKTEESVPGLRALLQRDWFTADKEGIRRNWETYGPLVFRWAAVEDAKRADDEHERRNRLFFERFGRLPWGNPES